MFEGKFIYAVGITLILAIGISGGLYAQEVSNIERPGPGQAIRSPNPFVPKLPPPQEEEIKKGDKKKDEVSVREQPSPIIDEASSVEQGAEEIINSLKVTGLVWNSKRPQAIINGQVVSIGDRIGEVIIMAIRPDSIDVFYGNKIRTITP